MHIIKSETHLTYTREREHAVSIMPLNTCSSRLNMFGKELTRLNKQINKTNSVNGVEIDLQCFILFPI